MTTHKQIATAALLAALFTTSVVMAEPKGFQGNTFGRRAAVQAMAPTAPARTARCDCRMMQGDAAMQTQCMGAAGEHPAG